MDDESRELLERLTQRVDGMTKPYTVPMQGYPNKNYKIGDKIKAPCGTEYILEGFVKDK